MRKRLAKRVVVTASSFGNFDRFKIFVFMYYLKTRRRVVCGLGLCDCPGNCGAKAVRNHHQPMQ